MLAIYATIDNVYLKNLTQKYIHNRQKTVPINMILNGTIYKIDNSGKKKIFKKFQEDVQIECPPNSKECQEGSIFTFLPDEKINYEVEFRHIYLTNLVDLNKDFFVNVGAMSFNKNYIALDFFLKIISLILLLTVFCFFWSGIRKLDVSLRCAEHSYVRNMFLLMIMVNEPVSSLNLDLSEKLGILNLVSIAAFYSYCLYFWLVMYEVRVF